MYLSCEYRTETLEHPHLHGAATVALGSEVDGGVIDPVERAHVGAALQETLHHRFLPVRRCRQQCRVALFVLRFEICSSGK